MRALSFTLNGIKPYEESHVFKHAVERGWQVGGRGWET